MALHARFARSGVIAGASSALAFTALHDWLISDIWATLPLMVASGALCGGAIAWSFSLLQPMPSVREWLQYNGLYLGSLALLGVVSIVVFEPVTTIAALVAANEPPEELFARAMPMTVVFTLVLALGLSVLYRARLRSAAAVLATCILVVALLGLNVSVLGLVAVPLGSVYLIAELFVLLIVLDLVYAVAFVALERSRLRKEPLVAVPM